jgi:hypothetical protein
VVFKSQPEAGMIDIERESLITLAEASRLLPGRPSAATLWRWRNRGVAGGRKLETVVIGGRPYTSREALARFARQQGGADAPASRSPRQRDKAIAQAEAELAPAGL